MTDNNTTDTIDIVKMLIQIIKTVSLDSLENDKALLELGEVITERVTEMEMRVHHLEIRLDMLLDLYHTHFGDMPEEKVN